MCFGCAATCAIQKIVGKNIDYEITKDHIDPMSWEIQSKYLHEEIFGLETTQEATTFEQAINGARMGSLILLFEFFEIDPAEYMTKAGCKNFIRIYDDEDDIICMETANWRKLIPFVEKKIKQLQEAGY